MCLNETHSRVRIGKNLSYNFTVQKGLKLYCSEWPEIRRCFIAIAFQLCFKIRHQEGLRGTGKSDIELDTSAFGL
jgi:hypothetical protein